MMAEFCMSLGQKIRQHFLKPVCTECFRNAQNRPGVWTLGEFEDDDAVARHPQHSSSRSLSIIMVLIPYGQDELFESRRHVRILQMVSCPEAVRCFSFIPLEVSQDASG